MRSMSIDAEARFLHTPERVAEAVRSGRREASLSQADLAAKAGTGRRFIVDLGSGHPTAQLGKTLAVLEALGITVAALPSPPAPDKDVDLDEVIDQFR